MTVETVVELVIEAIKVAMLVSAPLLVTALVVGLIISIFQSVTQIQEMTLTFIPKILATFFAMILTLPWMIQTLMDYIRKLFETMATLLK
ncbi:MAG: flagellar biosynthesis protein FliQ [Magnetococcales bacterium]|nr:flagellar biosynthesis protein FliQ [Magnetococcales bacterium]NGZ28764.1 flagellar biosynthesis protein FliQ [Magnetococcales bacterium]